MIAFPVKPALKQTHKATLYFEALNRVKIGATLFEPTCLFFVPPTTQCLQEAKTPSKFKDFADDF